MKAGVIRDKMSKTVDCQTAGGTLVPGQCAECAPDELPQFWRQKADEYQAHAVPVLAATYRLLAAQLEHSLKLHREQPLSLRQAALEGGYSEAHLGRLVAEGTIPNAGRKHAPRILGGTCHENAAT